MQDRYANRDFDEPEEQDSPARQGLIQKDRESMEFGFCRIDQPKLLHDLFKNESRAVDKDTVAWPTLMRRLAHCITLLEPDGAPRLLQNPDGTSRGLGPEDSLKGFVEHIALARSYDEKTRALLAEQCTDLGNVSHSNDVPPKGFAKDIVATLGLGEHSMLANQLLESEDAAYRRKARLEGTGGRDEDEEPEDLLQGDTQRLGRIGGDETRDARFALTQEARRQAPPPDPRKPDLVATVRGVDANPYAAILKLADRTRARVLPDYRRKFTDPDAASPSPEGGCER
ncbi:MAG: hypothetical protein WDN72_10510 [Alphaproteobacteria bacterium]